MPRAARPYQKIYDSARSQRLRGEMIQVGRKLWQRGYVDGNGGNISCRLDERHVLCTPAMLSKGDLKLDTFALVDMEGRQVAGKSRSTSEIQLHLGIYKAVPKAQACVHAHPPHATAYAITGQKPPVGLTPEVEMFLGTVAHIKFQTPGSRDMGKAIMPVAQKHNAILLANHGAVCWAFDITQAEWCMEILDTYCHTLILARQLKKSPTRIPRNHRDTVLQLRKDLGFPDPRFSRKEDEKA